MPTGFELDNQMIQKTIALHLNRIALELGKLNINLERIANTKYNQYQHMVIATQEEEEDAAIDRGFEADKE